MKTCEETPHHTNNTTTTTTTASLVIAFPFCSAPPRSNFVCGGGREKGRGEEEEHLERLYPLGSDYYNYYHYYQFL